jgi:hypothetical protein
LAPYTVLKNQEESEEKRSLRVRNERSLRVRNERSLRVRHESVLIAAFQFSIVLWFISKFILLLSASEISGDTTDVVVTPSVA